jgi:hypothetical protein
VGHGSQFGEIGLKFPIRRWCPIPFRTRFSLKKSPIAGKETEVSEQP